MKRLKIIACIIVFLGLGLAINNRKILHAENSIEEPSIEEVTSEDISISEENASQYEKTPLAAWFEKNLGWIVGLPVGTLISLIISAIDNAKKLRRITSREKKIDENNANTYDKVMNQFEAANNKLNEAKEIVQVCFDQYNEIKGLFIEAKNNQQLSNEAIEKYIERIEEESQKVDYLSKQVVALQQQFGIVVSQNVNYVKSGLSEEVNKLVGKIDHEEN